MIHGGALGSADRRKALRQAFILIWALLACVLFLASAPSGLRAPVEIIFFCFVPGAALVGLLNPDSFGVELSLSVALSVALSGLTAGILLYANLWSPTAVVVVIAAISIVGGLRDLRFGRGEHGLARLRKPRAPSRELRTADVPAMVGSRSERVEEGQAPSSPLHAFLLEELRERTGSRTHGTRWRRSARPRSLADLEPHELAELLSWSSLQRYVTRRAIGEVKPELWFVEDLGRRLRSQASHELPRRASPSPRGIWITGVSTRTSTPVAWQVLKDDGKNDWRTRLALEMIDGLAESAVGEAVVAADTNYGSLAGFRRGLTARGLSYLVRVDPVTALRELDPGGPSHSAADARVILCERVAVSPAPHGATRKPKLALVQAAEQVLICEDPSTEKDGVYWLSNLPVNADSERLDYLLGLANRGRIEREIPDLLQAALKMAAEEGTELDRDLAHAALAGSLETQDLPTTQTGEEHEDDRRL